jgi:hypothetical protein
MNTLNPERGHDQDMNHPSPSNLSAKPASHLLEGILAFRATVGDGLSDDELTRLLRQTTLLSEAGFGFISFSGGVVTLSVPPQEPARWYPENAWIAPEKERMARAIAEKHGLSFFEPPDQSAPFLSALHAASPSRHHLEFTNRREVVVIAHPHYLKVRLFGVSPDRRYIRDAQGPLAYSPDLLKDLSVLYRA